MQPYRGQRNYFSDYGNLIRHEPHKSGCVVGEMELGLRCPGCHGTDLEEGDGSYCCLDCGYQWERGESRDSFFEPAPE